MKVKSGGNNDHRLRDDDLIILTFENGRASLTDIFEKLFLQRNSQVNESSQNWERWSRFPKTNASW